MKDSSCYTHRETKVGHANRVVLIKRNTVAFPYRDEVNQTLLHLAFGQADNLLRLSSTHSLCAGGMDMSTARLSLTPPGRRRELHWRHEAYGWRYLKEKGSDGVKG